MRSSLTSISHASALPSSAPARRPLSPCRATPLCAGHPPPYRAACARQLPAVLRHDRPPTGTSDTEATDLEAAAAAPPSDLQQQELTVRLAKEKDSAVAKERQTAYDAALARLAQAEEEAANASKARTAAIAHANRERALATAAALQPSTPVESSTGGSASPAGGPADLHSALLL
jgi:hypothetical protein